MNTMSKAGYVAIIGRPNVGKSTLLNHLLGQKVSITSRKPQTTRRQILGILTEDSQQIVFVDTPGVLQVTRTALDQLMSKTVRQAIADVDILLLVLDARGYSADDQALLAKLLQTNKPVVVLLNKIDLRNQQDLLPYVAKLQEDFSHLTVIPVSALKHKNLDLVKTCLLDLLPESPLLYPEHMCSDAQTSFMFTELIREKVFRSFGQELPYACTVVLENVVDEEKICKIYALIYVPHERQKRIIIGQKGQKLKQVGTAARVDIEKYLGKKVFLSLWVKVKSTKTVTDDDGLR
jgi:GTPase